jgi:hypothetical protein
MALELKIQDAPRQDLSRFEEYVYRIRIENRPDTTYEEERRKRSIVDPRSIPFLEFDLPAHIVCPGCVHDWQKSLYVLELKRMPYQSAFFLIQQAVQFGLLDANVLPDWAQEKPHEITFGDNIYFQKPRLNLEDE